MELKTSFMFRNQLIGYEYDLVSGVHTVSVTSGCIRGAVLRQTAKAGLAASWLAQYRTTLDDKDPAQLLIRYLTR